MLVVGLACTAVAWEIAKSRVDDRAADRFRAEAADAQHHIIAHMQAYEQLLRGGVALFESQGGKVDQGTWRRFVATLQVENQFPGIQGIGFAQLLRPDQVREHERRLRAQGFPDYVITPAGARDRYSAIIYLEPLNARNRRAIGFDMLAEPVRRAAMDLARDTDMPAVSGRVTLVQETGVDVQPGFLMYLPVYRPGTPRTTVRDLRNGLAGYVYAPFRMGDLMRGILWDGRGDIDFELFDEGAAGPDALLYRSAAEGPDGGRFRETLAIELPGRTWTARFRSRPGFEAKVQSTQPESVLVAGLIISWLLFLAFRSMEREGRRVQQRAEEITRTLRETATRLQLAQDTAQLGIWERRIADGNVIWNQRMLELYDIPAAEFDGSDGCWRRGIHPDDVARVDGEREAALRAGGRFITVFRAVRRDGSVRYLEAQGAVIHDDAGKPQRVVGITRDITEQMEAEQARAAEHSRLQAIIDCIPEAVALKDAQLVYQAVNPAAAAFMGRQAEECVGRNDFEILPRAEAEMLRAEDLQVLKSGRPMYIEQSLTGASGPRWVEVIKAPLRGKSGGIEGVLVTARDQSALKRATEQLHREHAALEAVFSSTHANIAVMDRNFTFTRVNKAFCEAAGGPAEAFLGKSALDLFPGSETVRHFCRVAETGEPISVTASPFPHATRGDTFWDCTISPLKNAAGAVDGVVLTSIDCTERETQRKKVEAIWAEARVELEERVRDRTREWEKANQRLAVANYELESFSYSVSHDLRAPLRAINGFTSALAEDYAGVLDDNGREYIARVHAATVRMGELIDGLLNLARVFRSPISPRRVDLSAMAGEQAQLLCGDDPARQVRFDIDAGMWAVADESLVRVLMQNLLGNAWKFTSRREQAVIACGCLVREGRRVFYVRDNGVGFEMEYAGKLFKPFERLHAHGEFDGTGIGLATVRRIVQRHGGEVWGEGIPDRGAIIYFTLEPTREEKVAVSSAA